MTDLPAASALRTKQPTLSMAMIVRNCADDLERCLASVRARPWGKEVEIVVVDTMSNDDGKTLAVAKKYADKVVEYAGPNGDWTREMFAFDDAADARNHAFALASGRWVMWLDSDDVLVDPKEAQRLLEVNGRWRPVGQAPADKAMGMDPDKVIGLPDRLRMIDMHPDGRKITGFWAPYLYRFHDNDFERGICMTWQIRERIVRNDASWRWVRPAHEVLVPVDPKAHQFMGDMVTLAIVHKKVWDPAAAMYSLTRHKAILEKSYAEGVRNCQDILYLDNYEWALQGPVARRRELQAAGLECAFTPVDKSRVLARVGDLAQEQGYFTDAVAAYAAAIEVCPQIGDFYFKLAEVYEKADWWPKAIEWYERGVGIAPAHPFSDVTPRDHLVLMRIKGALCAHEASKVALSVKNLSAAEQYAERALALARAAYDEPCIGPDKQEAQAYVGLFENELNALHVAKKLFDVWDYLKKNDETLRARDVLSIVPHNLKDHPIVVEIEKWSKRLDAHLADTGKYAEFYEAIGTDITSNAGNAEAAPLPRTVFAIEQLLKERARLGRPLRILEVGPFDGISLLPIMRALPDCEFFGLEIKADAAERLQARIAALFPDAKATIVHGQLADADAALYATGKFNNKDDEFDAVIFFEVIEHVPNEYKAIAQLAELTKPGGLLFVSTPWGAFDRGHQPFADTRDERGHVRAMTPGELVSAIEDRGLFVVEEQGGCHAEGNYGDTLHSVSRRLGYEDARLAAKLQTGSAALKPVNFVVPSALWPWNASSLIRTGMGASEETIVYLARELAKDTDVKARVFGPLPKAGSLIEEEVNSRVQYSPREHARHLRGDAPIVVSRGPSYIDVLKEQIGGAPTNATLWLQDAYYPDLKEHAPAYKQIVVLSEWHKEQMRRCGADVSQMRVIPNFLLAEHFDLARVEQANIERDRALRDGEPRFVYASSPDRGLLELLHVWKHVIKEWPKAQLRIFYGWEGCMRLGNGDPGWVSRYREIREEYLRLKNQPGIVEIGRVNHAEIADWMRWAHVWPYVVGFGETFCSNAVKARAAGCIPVHSGVAALAETAECGYSVRVDLTKPGELSNDFLWRYFQGIKEATERNDLDRREMAADSIWKYELSRVAPLWRDLLGL